MNVDDLPEVYREEEWQSSPVTTPRDGLRWEVVINHPMTGEGYRLGGSFKSRGLADRVAGRLRDGLASIPHPSQLTRLRDVRT